MTPAEAAALALPVALNITRIVPALKGVWSSVLPPKLQWIPGVVLVAATELVAKLSGGVTTWTDLVIPVVLVGAMFAPGARSATHVAVAELAEESVKSLEPVAKVALEQTGSIAPPKPFFPPPDKDPS